MNHLDSLPVELRLNIVKPIIAEWLLDDVAHLQANAEKMDYILMNIPREEYEHALANPIEIANARAQLRVCARQLSFTDMAAFDRVFRMWDLGDFVDMNIVMRSGVRFDMGVGDIKVMVDVTADPVAVIDDIMGGMSHIAVNCPVDDLKYSLVPYSHISINRSGGLIKSRKLVTVTGEGAETLNPHWSLIAGAFESALGWTRLVCRANVEKVKAKFVL